MWLHAEMNGNFPAECALRNENSFFIDKSVYCLFMFSFSCCLLELGMIAYGNIWESDVKRSIYGMIADHCGNQGQTLCFFEFSQLLVSDNRSFILFRLIKSEMARVAVIIGDLTRSQQFSRKNCCATSMSIRAPTLTWDRAESVAWCDF